MDVTEGPF